MPIDQCLAKEGDENEGWQEHIRYNGATQKFERWYRTWGKGLMVETWRDLGYHDQKEWVEAKLAAISSVFGL